MVKHRYLLALTLLTGVFASAHPLPNSVVGLSIHAHSISGTAKIPLIELETAAGIGHYAYSQDAKFRAYFVRHIVAITGAQVWQTQIDSLEILTAKDPTVGNYEQVRLHFQLIPPGPADLRTFTFHYDAVIHQIVTHSIIVFLEQDWENGIQVEDRATLLGVIKMDRPTGKINPLEVNLEKGSWWKGFRSMVKLGMDHIAEGTDHLLFLLVLLLPAPLLVERRQWTKFGGTRYSISRLVTIVTAFTIGHSLSLLLGALKWLVLPQQYVEVAIAMTIFITAVHAFQPLFSGKESWIALGFGFIHGLAFSAVLSNLQLSIPEMASSILGFNIGIELMQLFVLLCTVPWLLILSRYPAYQWVRMIGSLAAVSASIAWMAERLTNQPNVIADGVDQLGREGKWIVGVLAVAALASLVFSRRRASHKLSSS